MPRARRNLLLAAAALAAAFGGWRFLRLVSAPQVTPESPAPSRSVPLGELIRRGPYTVAKVLDGDTVKLDNGETVRLIGVDAPEIHHPELPVQRFGQEASDFLKRLLEGFEVTLELEPADQVDKYRRTLAYLWKGDVMANEEIIRRGYAYAYTRFEFRRRDGFLALEREARHAQYGLWHLSLRDGRIANLVTRYDRLSLEGRKRFDESLEQLVEQFPIEEGGKRASTKPPPPLPPRPAGVIDFREASKLVGKRVTVEGRIVATRNTGKVCFLNFHADYRRYLTAVILGSVLKRFPGDPAKTYKGKLVRVTGEVAEKDGRLEIVIEEAGQIQVVE